MNFQEKKPCVFFLTGHRFVAQVFNRLFVCLMHHPIPLSPFFFAPPPKQPSSKLASNFASFAFCRH